MCRILSGFEKKTAKRRRQVEDGKEKTAKRRRQVTNVSGKTAMGRNEK